LNSDYADAYNNRGYTKQSMGDWLGAIDDFNKAISLKGEIADFYMNRGNSYD
jgi:tetratricopeptide (TPR) repeat protein